MSVESVTGAGYLPQGNIRTSSYEKRAAFESITGFRVDEAGVNKDVALERLNYYWVLDHSTAGCSNQDEKVEAMAKAYAEIYENISERFAEDEDERFSQIGKLNEAFDLTLRNSYALMGGGFPPKVYAELRASSSEEERLRNEREIAELSRQTDLYNRNVREVTNNFRANMARHMDTFFEAFISKIQKAPFEDAYAESMALLRNSETESLTEISYKDIISIEKLLANEPTEFDDDGFPVAYRYRDAEDALRKIAYDDDVPLVIRRDIAERFGFKVE